MTETEQKILDAALKVFARKGYDAATTRAIAEESGFTEMTLFRKFGTKKNLFDQVMIQGNKKIQENTSKELFVDQKFEDIRAFLEAYVKNLDNFLFDNFEFFHLSITEDSKTVEPIIGSTVGVVSEYLEKNLPNKKLDYKTFGFAISTFMYALNIDRYHKRNASFGDYQESLGKLVDILYCMLKD
jgi:TetR/AcrR family transcriptional regulator